MPGMPMLALTLVEQGAGRRTWRELVGRMPAFAARDNDEIVRLAAHMLDTGILFEDGGILGVGAAGDREFGHRHAIDLMEVFTLPPLLDVLHGRVNLGHVDALRFAESRVDREATASVLAAPLRSITG